MPDDITGKIAVVTGSSRGIGKAIAVALAEAGADVAVNYQSSESEARATCAEIEKRGRRAAAVQADVSVAADVARLVATVTVDKSLADLTDRQVVVAARKRGMGYG